MHGLGSISKQKNSEKRYGLWENGDRRTYFNSETVERIQIGDYDFNRHYSFMNSHKAHEFEPDSKFFDEPPIFTMEILKIKALHNQL